MYYRNVCKYVYQFPSNKCDDPQGVQGFVNWFYTTMIGQFGFVEYTGLNTFSSLQKVANWSIGI